MNGTPWIGLRRPPGVLLSWSWERLAAFEACFDPSEDGSEYHGLAPLGLKSTEQLMELFQVRW